MHSVDVTAAISVGNGLVTVTKQNAVRLYEWRPGAGRPPTAELFPGHEYPTTLTAGPDGRLRGSSERPSPDADRQCLGPRGDQPGRALAGHRESPALRPRLRPDRRGPGRVNGLGAKNGNPHDPASVMGEVDLNGVGNLIVGYKELGNAAGDRRTGSHNQVSGQFGSVSGGWNRSVSGHYDWRGGSLFETQ